MSSAGAHSPRPTLLERSRGEVGRAKGGRARTNTVAAERGWKGGENGSQRTVGRAGSQGRRVMFDPPVDNAPTIAELYQALAASQAECAELREAMMVAHRATEAAQEGSDIEGQSDESALEAYEEGTCAVLRATTPLLSRAPGGTEALRAHTERTIMETARDIVRRGDLLWNFMSKDGAEANEVSAGLYAGELDTLILTDYTDVDDPDFKRLVARLLPADAARGDAMKGADK